jgi:integrase/recombinase XerD
MKKNLQKLFDEYINFCIHSRRLRPTTIRGYKEVFRNFTSLASHITNPNLITAEEMDSFFKRLQTRRRVVGKGDIKVGVRDSTIMTYWSRFNTFFGWLEDRGHLEKNPLPNMRPAEPQYNNKKTLLKSDIEKIIGAIDTHSKTPFLLKRDKGIIYLLLFSGIRIGELVSLRVMDVDMEKGVLRINGETSKSKKTREIPMNPTLKMHLEEYLLERKKKKCKTEHFFVSSNFDKKLTTHGFKHLMKRIVELSGVKCHFHQFRHTFACTLGGQGISSYKLQKLLGHTDLRMTDRYLRSMGVEDLRDDIDRFSIDNLL